MTVITIITIIKTKIKNKNKKRMSKIVNADKFRKKRNFSKNLKKWGKPEKV